MAVIRFSVELGMWRHKGWSIFEKYDIFSYPYLIIRSQEYN